MTRTYNAASKIHGLCILSSSSLQLHIPCRRFSQFSGKQKDYYKILNLSSNASASEIKSAYFTLSKKYHPDMNEGISSAAFLDVVEAYEVLGNENKRHKYDSSLFYNPTYRKHPAPPGSDNKFDQYSRQAERYVEHPWVGDDEWGFKDHSKSEPKNETMKDAFMPFVMLVLSIAVVFKVCVDFENTSKNSKMYYPTVDVKKLETGALVLVGDTSKQKTASQVEKKT